MLYLSILKHKPRQLCTMMSNNIRAVVFSMEKTPLQFFLMHIQRYKIKYKTQRNSQEEDTMEKTDWQTLREILLTAQVNWVYRSLYGSIWSEQSSSWILSCIALVFQVNRKAWEYNWMSWTFLGKPVYLNCGHRTF